MLTHYNAKFSLTGNSSALFASQATSGSVVLTQEQSSGAIEQSERFFMELGKVMPSSNPLAHFLKFCQRNGCPLQAINVYKPAGYWSRLFSDETWEEWCESRTALGQVFACFSDYLNTPHAEASSPLEQLNSEIITQATIQAKKWLSGKTVVIASSEYSTEISESPAAQTAYSWDVSGFFSSIDQLLPSLPTANAQSNVLVQSNFLGNQEFSTFLSEIGFEIKTATSEERELAVQMFDIYVHHAKSYQDAKDFFNSQEKLLTEYRAEYNRELSAYKAAQKKYPESEGYYSITKIKSPKMVYLLAQETKNGETIPKQIQFAQPGYVKWEIYYNYLGPDGGAYDAGYLNFDSEKNEPTVSESPKMF